MASLTVKRVAKLMRAGTEGRHLDSGGNGVKGLYLAVRSKANASWLLRYQLDHRTRWMGLGSARDFTLDQARERAKAAREKLADKTDPLEYRRSERAAEKTAAALAKAKSMTFGQCAEDYIEANRHGWKNGKHEAQWTMTLLGIDPRGRPAKHDYCKAIRDLPVGSIDTTMVLKVLQPVWTEKTETASRVRGRIEKVLDRAKVLGLRSGENPARWVGHLDQLLPKRSQVAPVDNHPALPYEQAHEFMVELRQREGIAARALEFTILTAARSNETIGAKWSEIDTDKKLWTVPAARMKGQKGTRRRDHVVPLSPQALELLNNLPDEEGNDYLFIGGRAGEPLSNAAMAAVIDRMNEDRVKAGLSKWIDPKQNGREVVPHGFRSTFKDWCIEVTAYPSDMSEFALSHTLSDKVEAAYRRAAMVAKRAHMMADWASYCDQAPVKTADNVVPLRAVEAS